MIEPEPFEEPEIETSDLKPPEIEEAPSLYQHCLDVYNLMKSKAVVSEVPEHESHLVYTGFLTKEFAAFGLGQPYYTSVMRKLRAMGCCKQIQRGGGPSPSKWLLLGAPTLAAFNQVNNSNQTNTSSAAVRVVEQNTRDLSERITRLEASITRIIEAVELLGTRYKRLQKQYEEDSHSES